MSQTRLPPTSHHFWLKSPCNLSSSVNSMTLLSSLTFSGPFNISYIFLHLTNNDFWPPISLILPVVLQKGACCIIQPVPDYCLLSAYVKVHTRVPVFKAKSFILGRLSVQEQVDKIFTQTSEESFQVSYPLISTPDKHTELDIAVDKPGENNRSSFHCYGIDLLWKLLIVQLFGAFLPLK